MILVILGVVGVILLVLVLPPVKLLGGGGADAHQRRRGQAPRGLRGPEQGVQAGEAQGSPVRTTSR